MSGIQVLGLFHRYTSGLYCVPILIYLRYSIFRLIQYFTHCISCLHLRHDVHLTFCVVYASYLLPLFISVRLSIDPTHSANNKRKLISGVLVFSRSLWHQHA